MRQNVHSVYESKKLLFDLEAQQKKYHADMPVWIQKYDKDVNNSYIGAVRRDRFEIKDLPEEEVSQWFKEAAEDEYVWEGGRKVKNRNKKKDSPTAAGAAVGSSNAVSAAEADPFDNLDWEAR